MSSARTLWMENADLVAAAVGHPFVRGLGDGTLPRERFAGYVAQDAFFLESFARAYALALAHSPDRAGPGSRPSPTCWPGSGRSCGCMGRTPSGGASIWPASNRYPRPRTTPAFSAPPPGPATSLVRARP